MTIPETNDVVTSINHRHDDIIATTLLNLTIMAADRRGGRKMLSVDDFNAFKAMLAASNGIQPTIEQQPQAKTQQTQWRPNQQVSQDAINTGYDAVAEAIGQGTTMPPPNVMT